MTYNKGNASDGKHYWLTPDELLAEIYDTYDIDFDPCPYPKPDDFDGLAIEWGQSNYVNPPFGGYHDQHSNKKTGPTIWARKAIVEYKKGKRVVFIYPIDRWILEILEFAKSVRNLGNVKFCAIEDGCPGKGTSRPVAMFVLEPEITEDYSI